MEYMKARGVIASKVHRRNDTHSVTSAFKRPLPNVDLFYKEMVCIPVGWWVTREDREYIAGLVRSFRPGVSGKNSAKGSVVDCC